MTVSALPKDLNLSVEPADHDVPERILIWSIILRAVWDAAGNETGVSDKYRRVWVANKDESIGSKISDTRRNAVQWLTSPSWREGSLRFYLDLLEKPVHDTQKDLIALIGTAKRARPRSKYKKNKKGA